MTWEEMLHHCVVVKEKKEIKIYFKNGRLVDGWFEFRGEMINVPFRPWMVAWIYDTRDWADEEIYQDILRRFEKFKARGM